MIKYLRHIVLILTLSVLLGPTMAQQRLQINTPEDVEVTSLLPYLKVYETPHKITPEEAYTKLAYSKEAYKTEKNSFGYSSNYFWVHISSINLTPNQLTPYLIMNNPLLDSVEIWLKTPNGEITFLAIAGDAVNFSNRQIPTPKIAFELPLKPYLPQEYILCINKKHSSVSFPISLSSKEVFWEKEETDLLFYSIYFGCVFAIVCYVTMFYFRTKLIVFLWYVLYLIFIALYLMAEIGVSIQFITPTTPSLNNYAKPVTISIASIALIQFILHFLQIERYYPKLVKWFHYISILLFIITTYWVITPQWHGVQTVYFLATQNVVIFISLMLVVFSAVLTYRKNKVIVAFFSSAFLAVLLAGFSIIITEFGWIKKGFFNTNPLFVGSLIEITMLAAGLGVWYRNLQKEHTVLATKLRGLKDDMYSSFISGIESKKQKFSFELHDNIGSRLSNLSRMLEQELGHTKQAEKLRDLTKIARNLSHQLSPTPFTSISFEESLNQITSTISSHISTDLQVYIKPEQPFAHVQDQITKITKETLVVLDDLKLDLEVDLQFFVHDSEIVLSIEAMDYNINSSTVSVYLKEILEARTKKLYGQLDFVASPDEGLSIMITIPN